jgi:hypothetical protein
MLALLGPRFVGLSARNLRDVVLDVIILLKVTVLLTISTVRIVVPAGIVTPADSDVTNIPATNSIIEGKILVI